MSNKVELFDAYDINENKLDIDLIRGQKHKEGLYHLVVDIFTINEKGELLVTKRHPMKTFPLHWETSGGSVLKGETIYQGAIRELKEETGIMVEENDLQLFYKDTSDDRLYRGFLTFINMQDQTIILQEGETVDYKWIPLNIFEQFISEDLFVTTLKERFIKNKETFYKYVRSTLPKSG
ncbi:NUDIX hydrolase [Haloplasma contractile]|uniref:Isopentenyl-diphosphate delta-isomerase protein n=1 Tax=Haloplasma contractile SSD-17B TaxID=1033810 RepID=U2EE43_9MOLU|nr:NUDIX hydrolase [Haloplasma contractile]ERJ13258.1 isopentenyl-diphosphate delta-isomerase protein [Haloplasma contractile SSD-17B]